MNLLKKRPPRIEVNGGFIYNTFPKIELGKGFEVVVHSLAKGDADARRSKTERFEFWTERRTKAARSIRILATCVAPTCGSDQFHLIDRDNYPASEFFVPKEGMDLKAGNYLPFVLAHEFGILGLGFIGDDFYEEITRHAEVGFITLTN